MSTAVLFTASTASGRVYERRLVLSTLFDDSDTVKALKKDLHDSEVLYYQLCDQLAAIETLNKTLLHENRVLAERLRMSDQVAARCVLGLVRR